MLKKIIAIFVVFSFFSLAALGEGIKPLKIAVTDFSGSNQSSGQAAATAMTDEFTQSKHYSVFERSKIQKCLVENKYSIPDLIEIKAAAPFGKILGADYVIAGSLAPAEITRSGSYITETVVASARLVNIANGKIMMVAEETGQSNSYYGWTGSTLPLEIEASRNAAGKLARQFAWKIGFGLLPTENAQKIPVKEWAFLAGVSTALMIGLAGAGGQIR